MKEKEIEIIRLLNEDFKDAKCALNYQNVYQLLVAVMLSAQTTDKKVNKVTASLFVAYPSIESIANAKKEDIEKILYPLGLAKIKSNNLILLSKMLLEKYNGVVPNDKKELMKLSGIGNKSSEVVLAEGFKIPAFPVDTHILRISKRLGLSNSNSSLVTEKELKSIFEEKYWISLHHQLIFFGREICSARNPKCYMCKLKKYCLIHNKNL